LPNFTVVVPADGPQAGLATRAVYAHQGPVYLRLGRPKVESIIKDTSFTIGQAQLLRPGSDAAIIACGTMVHEACQAAEFLARDNISVRVVNMHTIKPLDAEAVLAAARETRVLLTAEEHSIIGGLGSAVAETLAEAGIGIPFKRIGVNDSFGESGEPDELFHKFGLDAENIVRQVKGLL
jgi:transketolase